MEGPWVQLSYPDAWAHATGGQGGGGSGTQGEPNKVVVRVRRCFFSAVKHVRFVNGGPHLANILITYVGGKGWNRMEIMAETMLHRMVDKNAASGCFQHVHW